METASFTEAIARRIASALSETAWRALPVSGELAPAREIGDAVIVLAQQVEELIPGNATYRVTFSVAAHLDEVTAPPSADAIAELQGLTLAACTSLRQGDALDALGCPATILHPPRLASAGLTAKDAYFTFSIDLFTTIQY